MRAVAPSGATAKVSAALGSTAAVTGAGNLSVALPVAASSDAMRPAEVEGEQVARGRAIQADDALADPEAGDLLDARSHPGPRVAVELDDVAAGGHAGEALGGVCREGATTTAPRAAAVRRVREERDMPP